MENVQMSFSPEVKRAIVEELESGRISLREAAVRGYTTVSRVKLWIDEYGKYKPKRDVVEVVMKSEEERISELEKALADAHLKNLVYEEMIALASKKFKVDLKKTFGPKVSAESGVKREPESKSSARR
jgi:transposase-like protein